MRKFTFLIGTTDDFESIEDLKACYFSGDHDFGDYNASAFRFELPEEAARAGVALLVGRGRAFEHGWCMDDTVSTLLEG